MIHTFLPQHIEHEKSFFYTEYVGVFDGGGIHLRYSGDISDQVKVFLYFKNVVTKSIDTEFLFWEIQISFQYQPSLHQRITSIINMTCTLSNVCSQWILRKMEFFSKIFSLYDYAGFQCTNMFVCEIQTYRNELYIHCWWCNDIETLSKSTKQPRQFL